MTVAFHVSCHLTRLASWLPKGPQSSVFARLQRNLVHGGVFACDMDLQVAEIVLYH